MIINEQLLNDYNNCFLHNEKNVCMDKDGVELLRNNMSDAITIRQPHEKFGQIVVDFENRVGYNLAGKKTQNVLEHNTTIGNIGSRYRYTKQNILDLNTNKVTYNLYKGNCRIERKRDANEEDIALFETYLKTKTAIAKKVIQEVTAK